MSYDNLCKRLAEQYPQAFLGWLLGATSSEINLLKTELSNEPIRADFLSFFQLEGSIIHLEFQTQPESIGHKLRNSVICQEGTKIV